MNRPHYSELPDEVHLTRRPDGGLTPSDGLCDLLVRARTEYDWPRGRGARDSQLAVLALESRVADLLASGDLGDVKQAVVGVCDWGGNNKKSLHAVANASIREQNLMAEAIGQMSEPVTLGPALDTLSDLPGLRLIMATKVYRFCYPDAGAALDRHSSYFFNSLKVKEVDGGEAMSTSFIREWPTEKHTTSRLAIYQPNRHARNRDEYVTQYLPLLRKLADALNGLGAGYTCAARGTVERWRPADVEMAAYYWWAVCGDR